MLELHLSFNSFRCEPLYMTAGSRCEICTYFGVRGVLRQFIWRRCLLDCSAFLFFHSILFPSLKSSELLVCQVLFKEYFCCHILLFDIVFHNFPNWSRNIFLAFRNKVFLLFFSRFSKLVQKSQIIHLAVQRVFYLLF